MRSAELASETILHAFPRQDFSRRRWRRYAIKVRQGTAPFLFLVRRFYEPAFLDLLFMPKPPLHFDQPAIRVLSGAAFDHRPLWLRVGLALFSGIGHIRQAIRWARGLPIASRWYW